MKLSDVRNSSPLAFKLGLVPHLIVVDREFGDPARSKMLRPRVPRLSAFLVVFALTVNGWAGRAGAEDQDSFAILQVGAAGEWDIRNRNSNFGPSVGLEIVPIEDWLEIETGVTTFFGHGHGEVDSDLIFQLPYTLSDRVEFNLGVGPVWVHTINNPKVANSLEGEIDLDFQIWSTPEHKIGWYVEPSYGYRFGDDHEPALGLSIGVMIPVR